MSNISCNYLFGTETSATFNKTMTALNISQEFINASLETIMKVSRVLMSKKGASLLFDPTAFNNQCHLYALMVAQKKLNERFFHLAFFLNYGILTDTSLMGKICDKTAQEITLSYPEPKKKFYTFLKDPEGERTRAARIALVALFESDLKKTLSSEESALYKELCYVARQDLQLSPSSGGGTVYTYPKFAGVVYMVDTIARKQLPLFFKVKVMTTQGTGSFTYCSTPIEDLRDETPLIVFEMIATDDNLTFTQCCEIAKRCPNHSHRNLRTAERHKEEETCLFCTDKRVDTTLFKERILPVLAAKDQMLCALGADFVLHYQQPYLPFFSDQSSCPTLAKLFQAGVTNVEKFALSLNKPLNMSVFHAHADYKSNALQETLVIDASYQQHLQRRGLL
jgi:hypothetical protein